MVVTTEMRAELSRKTMTTTVYESIKFLSTTEGTPSVLRCQLWQ